ncbi:MAG: tRNA pseudouridine(55) synthase TruB [Sporichthyaceae bacterium]
MAGAQPGPGGLLIVDKPAGMTSHDVVGRVRRLARTRKVGHAGTLDPMATGVLVLGLERTTRLLGHLSGGDKEYTATIRLGAATDSDDATGEVLSSADASGLAPGELAAVMATLTGDITQVPSTISAIKVDGKRSYRRARAGEAVELAARPVTVAAFDLLAVSTGPGVLDLAVRVSCSSGTYVRALARDLGSALGVGGHLRALRRTRVGPFDLAAAHELSALELAAETGTLAGAMIPLGTAAGLLFPQVRLDPEQARILAHGGWIRHPGSEAVSPVAAFGPTGEFLALATLAAGRLSPLTVFVHGQNPSASAVR